MYLIATVCNTETIFIDAIIDEIDNADDVYAEEVVYCKDCKHRKKWTNTGQFCCFHETSGMAVGVDLRDDDFCSYGERGSDEQKDG